MFRFIQSRLFLQLVALLAVVVWAVFQVVTSMHYVGMPDPALCWQAFAPLQNHYVALCLLFTLGLLIQIVLADIYYFRCGFGDTHHLMVVFWYMLLLCCGGCFGEFSPVWMSNVLLVVIISLNFDYEGGNQKSKDILSGILIGISSLFYPPVILLSFFVIFSLIINKFSKHKDIAVFLLGILTVYLYVFCYFFFTDQLVELRNQLSQMHWYNTFRATSVFSWREILLVSAAVLSWFYSILILKIEYGNKQVLLRKRLLTIHLIMISTLLLLIFSPFGIRQSMGFLVLPMSLYYAMLSQIKQHSVANDLMMLIFAVALCL